MHTTHAPEANAKREPDCEETLIASDDTPLWYREWRPEPDVPPRGAVLLVHGYGEHLGRYGRLARQMTQAGFVAGGGDHRGMGKSGGTRAFVRDYATYLDDLARHEARLCAGLSPDLPLFVYGHSMGGLIALRAAETTPAARPRAGTILSAPLVGVNFRLPAWQIALGRIVARLRPTYSVAAPLDPTILTHDPDERASLAGDPLMLQRVTLGWFFATGEAMEAATRDAPRLQGPTLWLIPGADRLCAALASRALFDALPDPQTHAWREYPGLFHNLSEECPADRATVLGDLTAWLIRQAETPPSSVR